MYEGPALLSGDVTLQVQFEGFRAQTANGDLGRLPSTSDEKERLEWISKSNGVIHCSEGRLEHTFPTARETETLESETKFGTRQQTMADRYDEPKQNNQQAAIFSKSLKFSGHRTPATHYPEFSTLFYDLRGLQGKG